MAEAGAFTDESAGTGVWGDGPVWTWNEIGIIFDMLGLYWDRGISHRVGVFTDETPADGKWGNE